MEGIFFLVGTALNCIRSNVVVPSFPSLADVYSYDEDDMVLDPNLAEHLAHFGIDMLKMQKVRRGDGAKDFGFCSGVVIVVTVPPR